MAAFFCTFCLCAVFTGGLASCTLTKHIALDSLSDSLAGSDKKGRAAKIKQPENSLMPVLTGEADSVLMGDFFPTVLKLYEIITAQNPRHQGLSVMTGSLYIMYANAFVQMPAEMLDASAYALQAEEQKRAKLHYLRGSSYALRALDMRYPGLAAALESGNFEDTVRFVGRLKKQDVPAAYWTGAGRLGAFSADPLDTERLKTLPCTVALLEKAAELDPDYNGGAVWDALTAFYALAPAEFGGNIERAHFTSAESFRASGGKNPSPYITYATSFCVPNQDVQGFKENLKKALAFDIESDPANRLALVIAQKKAAWLLDRGDDFFIEWE
ncbi:hypothetical protein H0R92_07310 [Treponema sp. OMZ 840]